MGKLGCRCAKLGGYFLFCFFYTREFFFGEVESESSPRLAPIYGDVVGFRGAQETELRKKIFWIIPPNKEAPNVAPRDSAAALQ